MSRRNREKSEAGGDPGLDTAARATTTFSSYDSTSRL